MTLRTVVMFASTRCSPYTIHLHMINRCQHGLDLFFFFVTYLLHFFSNSFFFFFLLHMEDKKLPLVCDLYIFIFFPTVSFSSSPYCTWWKKSTPGGATCLTMRHLPYLIKGLWHFMRLWGWTYCRDDGWFLSKQTMYYSKLRVGFSMGSLSLSHAALVYLSRLCQITI